MPFPVGEFPDDEFAFEFEAGDEEEHGEQAVLGPGAEGEVQMEGGRPDREIPQRLVRRGERGELAHPTAIAAATSRIDPPTVSVRRYRVSSVLHGAEPDVWDTGDLSFGAGYGCGTADQTSRHTCRRS